MSIEYFRIHARGSGRSAALLAAAVLALCPALSAQSTQPASASAPNEEADLPQRPLPGQVVPLPSAAPRTTSWELVGGYERDSHDTGYGFAGPAYFRPLSGNVTLTAQLYFTHLSYAYDNGLGGETSINAPGINPAIGLRFGGKNWFRVTTGLDIQRQRQEVTSFGRLRSTDSATRVGMSLGADGWWNPTSRSNVHTMVQYGSASKYTWGRIAAKQQVSNMNWSGPLTLFLGGEGIGQGNDVIRSWQLGGLAELAIAHSQLSLTVRGGYKRSTFDLGPSKDGPYFGVGLWKRF